MNKDLQERESERAKSRQHSGINRDPTCELTVSKSAEDCDEILACAGNRQFQRTVHVKLPPNCQLQLASFRTKTTMCNN